MAVSRFSYRNPFVVLCFLWIAGFFVSEYIFIPDYIYYILLSSTFIIYWIPNARNLSSAFLLVTFFICSAWSNRIEDINLSDDNKVQITCRCEERLANNNYIVSTEKHRLFLQNSSGQVLSPGDDLVISGRISLLKNRNNENAFSYTAFLNKKGVRYKIDGADSIWVTGHSRHFKEFFKDIRNHFIRKSDTLFKDKRINSMLKSLGLGYREELEEDTRQLFTDTGTIHLLAVSGLHMGAVYYMLLFLLKCMGIKNRRWNILIIPILWCYAGITGLSPSVVRAAQILSFIIAGEFLQKDYSPVNAIAASALFTLIGDPYQVFSLSMQMSYAAYTGIIVFNPILKKIPGKLSGTANYLYSLLCISISAQILTLPLSAYYFHYFSINSFLINIVAVPVTSFILYGYLVLLLLPVSLAANLSFAVVWAVKSLFYLLERFYVVNIVWRDIYPTHIHVIFIYLLAFAFTAFLIRRKRSFLNITVIIALLLLFYSTLHIYRIQNKNEIVVFHLFRDHCILLNYKGYYISLSNIPLPENKKSQYLPYIKEHKLKSIPTSSFTGPTIQFQNNLLTTKKQNIWLMNEKDVDIIPTCTVWIVSRNILPSQINVTNESFPEKIIVDGSNEYRNSLRWQEFCQHHNIQFYSTYEKGSVVISLR